MTTIRREVEVADGTRIPVWISGQGRPLLIIPGAAADHEAWEPVREYLEPHVTVAIMDRRAVLEDPLNPLDLEQEFDDIAEVAASLGDEVDLMGHSSGGDVALWAGLGMNNLRRLVLYESGLGPEEGRDEAIAFAETMMEEHVRAGNAEPITDVLVEWMGSMYPAEHEAWEAARDKFLSLWLPREVLAISRVEVDYEKLRGLSAPTMYLIGSETPPETVRHWLEPLPQFIPNLTVRELPGLAHLANWTGPDVISEVVLEFVQAEEPHHAASGN